MKKRMIFLALVFPLLLNATTPTAVEFFTGPLVTAKEKAAQEGKLYFVDFVASWCMPCRWMDETTFSDPNLAQYVHSNYIPVKVDIDDFDGYAYKQQYNIKMLPSILIFNSKGELVDRYHESLPPSKLLKILQKNNTASNRVVRPSSSPSIMVTPPRPIMRPPAANMPKPPVVKPPVAPTRPATPSNYSSPAKTEAIQNHGLYRFSVSPQDRRGYSVQIGVFGEYGNVLREVAKLEAQFNEPVIVDIGALKGKTVYKIMVGAYDSREAANSLKERLGQQGILGIIKNLSP